MSDKMINEYTIQQNDSIDKFRVKEDDLKDRGLQSGGTARVMKGTAAENRKKFDLFPAFVAQQHNGLIEFLKSTNAGGNIGVFVNGYDAKTLSEALAEITNKVKKNVEDTFMAVLRQTFEVDEDGKIKEIQATLVETDTQNTVLDCTLSNYNADNALATFGELVRTDTVGVAFEKLYKGIADLNEGVRAAKKAQDFSDDGTIKATLEKIANLNEENNGKFVANIARDYSSGGGIATELDRKMNKSAFEFDGTNLTINL